MFNFCSLYSGSNGNSLFVETDKTKILIDAGESAKKISTALSLYGADINDIDAMLITHEHSDHVKSLGTIVKKYNIPVYANEKTWNAMPQQKEKIPVELQNSFKNDAFFELHDLSIYPFSIPHDAADPCGFNIYYDNKKITVATDIGHITDTIFKNIENSSFALLESNYDLNALQCSKYPFSLKRRISGPNGHLSNTDSGKLISKLISSGLTSVMLGHLSKENNFPELAYKTVVEELINNNYDENSITIQVAKRDSPSKLIHIA